MVASILLACLTNVVGVVHWGLNTYCGREWGFGNEAPAKLVAQSFDAEGIADACASNGIKRIILVAKHYDGFCLWPSAASSHTIAASPYREGKGDIVAELSAAARKRGLGFGVALSLWERCAADFGESEYLLRLKRQVAELCGGKYGQLSELWLDDQPGGDGWYGGVAGGRGASRVVGKDYYPMEELRAVAKRGNPTIKLVQDREALEALSLRRGWYFHPRDRHTQREPKTLLAALKKAEEKGEVLYLGLAPDRSGRLEAEDVKALATFAAAVREKGTQK